jgi:hypothetical protein
MMFSRLVMMTTVTLAGTLSTFLQAEETSPEITAALKRAGENRGQIQAALDRSPKAQREGMQFLVTHMPGQDLKTLTAEFLLENLSLAYQAREESAWKAKIPHEIFLNNVLPYATINEKRDRWRKDFHDRFLPVIKDVQSPGLAAAKLNQNIFKLTNVKYSTKRAKADQSPYESMESGLASCTGLSVLLVDACRSVGIPARFAGTPLWTNKSGNHSWVEIWDDGWHFTGACEATGNSLDRGWFAGRAATAKRDELAHAIFAVSYKRTPQFFPMAWAADNRSVHAVNVTDRYTRKKEPLPEGVVIVMFRAVAKSTGDRGIAAIKVTDQAGQVVFEGKTKDERFDANDHVEVRLRLGEPYQISFASGKPASTQSLKVSKSDHLVTLPLP